MKKIVVLSWISIVGFCILSTGCASENGGSPETVLKSFFKQLTKKDIQGAAKLATDESKPTLDLMKHAIELAVQNKDTDTDARFLKELENVEMKAPRVEEDLAYITVTNKNNKASAEFILVKQHNKWKVDFSMAVLLKMAQQQWQQHNSDVLDSFSKVDAEGLQHSFEMADSILKNIDPKQLEEIQQHLEKSKQE